MDEKYVKIVQRNGIEILSCILIADFTESYNIFSFDFRI